MGLGRSDDRCTHRWLGQQPGKRDLGRWYGMFVGDRAYRVEDVEVVVVVLGPSGGMLLDRARGSWSAGVVG